MTTADGSLDHLLSQLGTGRWNYLFFATSSMVPAVLPIYLIGSEFLNPEPKFTCNIPDNDTKPVNGSQCLMMEDIAGEESVIPCKNWTYDTSIFHSTVSMDWNLICDQAWLSPLFQSIYTAGCFFGSILAGVAANRYGRRWAVRAGIVLTFPATWLLILAPWLPLALTARFLLGVFNTIMVCPAFMLSMEVCVPNLRPTVGILLALPYAIMMIGIALMAYLIRDWRWLQMAGSAPCIFLLPLVYFVDESPRWLIMRGHLEEAVKVLQRAVKLNRVTLPAELDLITLVSVIHQKQGDKSSSVCKCHDSTIVATGSISCQLCLDRPESNVLGPEDGFGSWWAGPVALVRTPVMRKLSLVLVVVFLLQGIVYLGLPLSSEFFSSPFLYMALLGAVELPAYSLTAPITRYLGRRTVVSFCLVTCGLLLLSVFIVRAVDFEGEWLFMLITLLSYLLVCTAYQVNFLYAPELLPTTLRPWGMAACSLAAYIGFSIPPFITKFMTDSLQWVPVAVFGICGVSSGLLVFLLPETNKRSLPETVGDLRDRLNKERLLTKSCNTSDVMNKEKNLESYDNTNYTKSTLAISDDV